VPGIKQNYYKLALYDFFQSFIIAYAIERLFWEQRGMTVQMVVVAEILYALLVAALELPTGYLADRWSRKWMMVVGAVFACGEFAVLIFATEFWHFALVVALAAVSGAATSGTRNALLYDSLKATGEEVLFEKKLGRLRAVQYGAHMVAGVIGGVVAVKSGLLSTYWWSLASVVMAVLVSLTLVEPPIRTVEKGPSTDATITKKAYAFLRQHPHLRFVLGYGVITGACLVYVDEFWQLYARDVGLPLVLFGVVLGINCLLTSISGLVAYKLKDKMPYSTLFVVALGLFALGTLLMAVFQNIWGLLFLFLSYGAAGIIEPLVSGYLHHRSPSEFRATAESYQSLAYRLTTIAVGLSFGYLSTRFGIMSGYLLLGILLWLYFGIFVVAGRRFYAQQLETTP